MLWPGSGGFDGLTLFVTLRILVVTVGDAPELRLPVAIVLDLLLAAAFAVLSLWCGLAWTEYELKLGEILLVFKGRSPDGLELGGSPYFWALHTAFLPTCFYLLRLAKYSDLGRRARHAVPLHVNMGHVSIIRESQ